MKLVLGTGGSLAWTGQRLRVALKGESARLERERGQQESGEEEAPTWVRNRWEC